MEKTNVNPSENQVRKPFTKKVNKFSFNSDYVQHLPAHLRNLVVIVKNNAEIRRFTALGIINTLKQKGIVDADAKCFVSFLWDKWSIKINGFATEYPYSHNIFLTSLVASFASFSAHAQRTINVFCNEEINKPLAESVKTEEVDALAETVISNDSSEEVTDPENGD